MIVWHPQPLLKDVMSNWEKCNTGTHTRNNMNVDGHLCETWVKIPVCKPPTKWVVSQHRRLDQPLSQLITHTTWWSPHYHLHAHCRMEDISLNHISVDTKIVAKKPSSLRLLLGWGFDWLAAESIIWFCNPGPWYLFSKILRVMAMASSSHSGIHLLSLKYWVFRDGWRTTDKISQEQVWTYW